MDGASAWARAPSAVTKSARKGETCMIAVGEEEGEKEKENEVVALDDVRLTR